MADLLQVIKQAAVEAVGADKPVQICFGLIRQVDPLKIQVGELELPAGYFLLGETVKGKLLLKKAVKGDRVLLLKAQGGQRFCVLDLIPGADWDPDSEKIEPPPTLSLLSTRYAVALNADGTLKDSSAILLTAVRQNDDSPLSWTTVPPVELGGTGNIRSLSPAVFAEKEQVQVRVTARDGMLMDYAAIVRVQDGSAGTDGEDAYRAEILSDNGNVFKNGEISTVLRARVYRGAEDVTARINAARFRWARISKDTAGDVLWNERYFGGVKEIVLTNEDVQVRATFTCEITE